MKIYPIKNNIVVKPDEIKETSKGGIILTAVRQEKPSTGIVLECGKDVRQVKKGYHVVYAQYAGMCIDPDDKELLLMKEDDILGVIN